MVKLCCIHGATKTNLKETCLVFLYENFINIFITLYEVAVNNLCACNITWDITHQRSELFFTNFGSGYS